MIKIEQSFDRTQKEFVVDIARVIYKQLGYNLPDNPEYLFSSLHPTEVAVLRAAEDIFELLTGDSPDYEEN